MRIVVVVLAGGAGRRMGGDKPLRSWRGGTLVEQALAKARNYAPTVALAVRDPVQVGAVDAPLLIDDPAMPGPIAGLASAIAYASGEGAEAVLTLPCDVPLAPPELAERLAGALDSAHAVAMAQSCGRLHPTCALWRSDLGPQLAAYAATGRSSLRGFAEAASVRLVDWGACEPDPFANVNTPEDLERLARAVTR